MPVSKTENDNSLIEDRNDKKNENDGLDNDDSQTKKTEIDEWIINSPQGVRIIGCGEAGSKLVENIFSLYEDKLNGLEYRIFNKPTKLDYLDLKLKPDFKNIYAAKIKREINNDISNMDKKRSASEDSVELNKGNISETSESKSDTEDGPGGIGGNSGIEKNDNGNKSGTSILNRFLSLIGSRQDSKTPKNKEKEKSVSEKGKNLTVNDSDLNDIQAGNQSSDGISGEIGPAHTETQDGYDIRDKDVEQAVMELRTELESLYKGTDLVFIITDMKSTYGLDNTLIAAETAKENNIITVGLVQLPERIDKLEEVEYGNRALQSLRLKADIIVVVPYLDSLTEGYFVLIINELLELMTTSGLVNLDVADIKTVVGGGNVAMLGFGSARGSEQQKILSAINEAVSSPILNIDLEGIKRTLVNVTGDKSMTVSEAQRAAKLILERIQPDARLIWGATVNERFSGAIKVMVMVGISPKNILVHIYANS